MPSIVHASLLPLLLASSLASAVPASVTPGKTALLCTSGGQFPATWSGTCKNGLADGTGVATWTDEDGKKVKLNGTLLDGETSGSATMLTGETTYIGFLEHFVPQGQGFYKFANGDMYEGWLDQGYPQGPGIRRDVDMSRYEGEWVAGKREGQGQASFALGGSYDGHWHNDVFDGRGTIVYAGSGRTYTGQFKDGRAVDLPAPVQAPAAQQRTYQIQRTTPSLDSYIPPVAAKNSPTSGARWEEMSDAQRQNFKRAYTALAEGDEPPYPANGLRTMISAISEMHGILFDHYGVVRVQVLVDANGKAKSVKMVGKVRDDVADFIGRTMLLTPWKPAICQGQPCEMMFAMAFNLL